MYDLSIYADTIIGLCNFWLLIKPTMSQSSLDSYQPALFSASVVFLFFVSWTPFHFQRLGYVYFKSAEFFREVNQYLFYFSGKYYDQPLRNKIIYKVEVKMHRISSNLNQFSRILDSVIVKRVSTSV